MKITDVISQKKIREYIFGKVYDFEKVDFIKFI